MVVRRRLVTVAIALLPSAGGAATFTVTTPADFPDTNPGDGVCATTILACSLRAAIEEANATPALDTIAFAIPGPGVHTMMTAALPAITQPIVVDGFTQAGSQPNTNPAGGLNTIPRIELRGGLVLRAGDATVRGIVSNEGTLVFEAGPGTPARSVVEGCFVGTDPTGTAPRSGGFVGVRFSTPSGPLRVGGPAPAQRSLVSGHAGSRGIEVTCAAGGCPPGSVIQGNLIGTDVTGTAALLNARGISADHAGGLLIGGTTAAERNVVSGNGAGIALLRSAPTSPPILVQGNFVGVDATGTQPIPNATGISAGGCGTDPSCTGPYVTIGGSAAAANRVARNGDGIVITAGQVTVSHNAITANTARGMMLMSQGPGIAAQIADNAITANADWGIWVRTTYDTTAGIVGNEIRGNGGGVGLELSYAFDTLALLASNSIHDNGGLGIDIGGDGVTPNDPFDADGGFNGFMNYPVLAHACSGSVGSVVTGHIPTRPATQVTVQFFRSPSCDPSGHGEGRFPAESVALTTDASGSAPFSLFVNDAFAGQFITATATSSEGTSEFSRCIQVDEPPPGQAVAGPGAVCAGTPLVLETAGGAQLYQWLKDGVPIAGATAPRYAVPAAGPGDAGTYTVRATSCGTQATSPPHAVTVVACGALPVRLDVDVHPSVQSNLNRVLEAGESVMIEPRYRNVGATATTMAGTATLAGPPGATYVLQWPNANYGTVAPGQLTDCFAATGMCFSGAEVTAAARPRTHWDASFVEATSAGDPPRHWPLHVGGTFTDVPVTHTFYRFVETLVHAAVTAGCTEWTYCPDSATTRGQMAVFVLVAKEGAGYRPPDCTPAAPRFDDVPASSPFCRWIEELARRNVVAGCTASSYCPSASVSREQMAVFVLATREAPGYAPPACIAGAERFADVPASSVFCRWIEELARRGVVAGCGSGNYCPASAVTRGQMSVFLTVTFGLLLYGP